MNLLKPHCHDHEIFESHDQLLHPSKRFVDHHHKNIVWSYPYKKLICYLKNISTFIIHTKIIRFLKHKLKEIRLHFHLTFETWKEGRGLDSCYGPAKIPDCHCGGFTDHETKANRVWVGKRTLQLTTMLPKIQWYVHACKWEWRFFWNTKYGSILSSFISPLSFLSAIALFTPQLV